MHSKQFVLAALASAFLSASALAQSTVPAPSASPDKPMDPVTVQSTQSGQWLTSKLIGVGVYNPANEKIGEISDLLADKSGRIDNVVIGVGGFLGMGEHRVLVPYTQLQWVDDSVRASSTTTTGAGTTGSGATTTTITTSRAKDHPVRVVLDMSKDQLKTLPAFDRRGEVSSTVDTTTSSPSVRQVPTEPTAR